MQEYWHSSLLACERYLNSPCISVDQKLYKRVPNSFKEIRPWVKYGWEMILIVHEIIKKENPIIYSNKEADMFETNLMRRLAGLLYIDNKIMGDIKEKIKKENQ